LGPSERATHRVIKRESKRERERERERLWVRVREQKIES